MFPHALVLSYHQKLDRLHVHRIPKEKLVLVVAGSGNCTSRHPNEKPEKAEDQSSEGGKLQMGKDTDKKKKRRSAVEVRCITTRLRELVRCRQNTFHVTNA